MKISPAIRLPDDASYPTSQSTSPRRSSAILRSSASSLSRVQRPERRKHFTHCQDSGLRRKLQPRQKGLELRTVANRVEQRIHLDHKEINVVELFGSEQRLQCSRGIAPLSVELRHAVGPGISDQLLILGEFMVGVRLPTEAM